MCTDCFAVVGGAQPVPAAGPSPSTSAAAPASSAVPSPRRTTARESPGTGASSEASLDFWGTIFRALAWLNLLLVIVGFGAIVAQESFGVMLVILAIASAMWCFFFTALLRGAADVVRLLKKSNGLRYEGNL